MSESKNKLINHALIHWSDQSEPISAVFDDVYFNTEEGIAESFYVFFQGNQLWERWLTCESEYFVIAETGFGTGLNFLVCASHFQQFLLQHPEKPLKRLLFTSFEKYPLTKPDMISALQRWPSLNEFSTPLIEQYPLALSGCHRLVFEQFNISLDLWFGDVQHTLPALYRPASGLFDCWYLDGFAPSKNPEMWSEQLFKEIADSCKKDASIATFTAAGFVRRGLIAAGFTMQKRKGYGKKREMLVGRISTEKRAEQQYADHFRPGKQTDEKDLAIVGGGIASACLSLALLKRGYKVTLYCKDASLCEGAADCQQAALYPLLNEEHSALSQFFANSFLYARNYAEQINQFSPFAYDFSGLLQLYSDQATAEKLDKISAAQLPRKLVRKLCHKQTEHIAQRSIGQQSLYYELGGWLNPKQMVLAIFKKAQSAGELTIKFNQHLDSFSADKNGWKLHFAEQTMTHPLLVLTTAMNSLAFKHSQAQPFTAARGKVTAIPTKKTIQKLRVTLGHEEYLTAVSKNRDCVAVTFKPHQLDTDLSAPQQIDNELQLAKSIPDKGGVGQIASAYQEGNVAIRCTTRAHFPYAGALANYEETKIDGQNPPTKVTSDNPLFYKNLFLFNDLGAHSLCTAPLLAEMLASQINNEPLPFTTEILKALQTNRQRSNYLQKR